MPPATQNQVIEQANESAKARASEAVSSEPTMTAPDVSKIEAPAQPLNLPNTQTTVGALEQFTSVTPEMLQQQRELQKSQKEQKNTLEDIYSGLADLGTRGATTIKMEEAAGIPQLNTALIEVENEIASKTLLFRRERERIEQAGGSIAQVNAELQDVGRKQNRELADLETIRAARSNTLTNAQNLINRKIELEFGDKQARIDALKYIYNENKDVLNKAEDKQFQTMLRREERGFEVAKQKFVQLEEEKMKYLTNAAQAGADNNTLKTIQSAESLDQLYSMQGIQQFALSQAEILDIQAKRQSIYSSAVSTLLALAKAGDANAIKELGFDPRLLEKEPEKLDATTKRQLEEKVTGSKELLTLAKEYQEIVEKYGYTNQIFGNKAVIGKVDSIRSQMTAAYKKAETLGTLDRGVLDLMAQLIGERPVSNLTGFSADNANIFANLTGGRSRQISAAMDTFIETTEAKMAEAEMRLGRNPLDEAIFTTDENKALDAAFGQTTTTTSTPANYYQ